MALTLLLVATGCEQGEVMVISNNQDAYGRAELVAAIDRFAKSDRLPEDFQKLAASIDTLRPRFDHVVRDEAERHLVVLALAPLIGQSERSPDEQMNRLGTTVWPSALGVVPEEGESAWQYGERLCGGALALECKYVVSEYRALVLSALVWERLRERAYEAVKECMNCRGQSEYQQALETYDRYHRDIADKVAAAGELAHPRRWPTAGEHASPWSGTVLLEVRKSGPHVLGGESLAAGELAPELHRVHQADQRLGILIRASAPVSELRATLREVALAGFDQVALQVRASSYPFGLAEYSLSTSQGHAPIAARDIDTVQILVQALDVAVETGDTAPRI
jgi:hypothetical protein